MYMYLIKQITFHFTVIGRIKRKLINDCTTSSIKTELDTMHHPMQYLTQISQVKFIKKKLIFYYQSYLKNSNYTLQITSQYTTMMDVIHFTKWMKHLDPY